MAEQIQVTIAVVPREKFNMCLTSLDSVLANTTMPYKLLYIDGNSPADVRDAIKTRLAGRHNTTLLRYDHYLGPVQAYNIAVERADTTYVVFMDNDVYVRPGWLEAMVRCAEEEQADGVTPIIMEGTPDTDIIHAYGGAINFDAIGGKREFWRVQSRSDEHLSEVRGELQRETTHLMENHLSMARTSAVKAHGKWDEWMGNHVNAHEYPLLFDQHKQKMVVEPGAEAIYLFGEAIRPTMRDFAVWNVMWSEHWRKVQYDLYTQKYGLNPNLNTNKPYTWWLGWQRRMIYFPVMDANRRFWSRLRLPFVGKVIEKGFEQAENIFNIVYVESLIRRRAFRPVGVPSIFGKGHYTVTPPHATTDAIMAARTADAAAKEPILAR